MFLHISVSKAIRRELILMWCACVCVCVCVCVCACVCVCVCVCVGGVRVSITLHYALYTNQ